MMVDPEWYYEEMLKGKPPEQIKKEIRSLQRKIGHLKKVAANPQDYVEDWGICPDPKVQLEIHRLYLQKAQEILADMGNKQ